jgi:hypothetical protein
MPTIHRAFGFLGVLICLSAFVIALIGTAYISLSYVYERARCSWCGTPLVSLQTSAILYGIILIGIAFGGKSLADRGGFTSHWWRFWRNLTVGLCLFTVLFTLCY